MASASRGSLREVLRSRQEARNRKSCDPCRERKVRCDKGSPCATCSKRGYPDLCSYRNPRPEHRHTEHRVETIQSPQDGGITSEREQPAADLHAHTSPNPSHSIGVFKARLTHSTSIATLAQEPSTHLIDGPSDRAAFETGVLPLLGVNEATSTEQLMTVLENALLSSFLSVEQDVYALFRSYKHRVHPFHSIPLDLDQMEKRLCAIIEFRHSPGTDVGLDVNKIPRWLCLLHAVLAYGAQFSDMPLERRFSLSHEHTKLAFELLVKTDYLARPSKETIQTLLILGNVLQDDMKPQAAWALVGTTIRLAQSLGMNTCRPQPESLSVTEGNASLRLAIVRQEALLSVAFGRSPSCSDMNFEEDLPTLTPENSLTYRQAMGWLCHIAVRFLESRKCATAPPTPLSILKKIDLLDQCVSPHLKDRHFCGSAQDIEECYAFDLHKNFVISALCRPFLSDGSIPTTNDRDSRDILDRLQGSLKRSAWAYIRLRTMSPLARRSWAFIHNGLTSVLLLSLMKETRHDDVTKTLRDSMIISLQQEKDDYSLDSNSTAVGLLSGSLTKTLKALQTMKALVEREAVPQNLSGMSSNAQVQGNSSGLNESIDFVNQQESWSMAEWLASFDSGDTSLGVSDFILSEPFASEESPFLV
ncbi:c6 zinc finger domain-containing protein [Hypoxylon trugodes]|uniref:c6 zinc finger domain-containing protein n=1 Tax=Hypoxylon trugodes TaxID=326681 RepID=UPI00218F029A|nr:c6 zinc finger domain-containing protein [Hypoxylon trugodes]KAI1387611.1 c6 zinc finger domain-containing protein [Hypoxylon trugodes]